MVTILGRRFKMMIAAGFKAKYIRCDDTGEHQTKVQKVCEENGVILEYTAPHIYNMNGIVERRYGVNLNRALPMCYSVGLKDESIKIMWIEAYSTENLCMDVFCNTGQT